MSKQTQDEYINIVKKYEDVLSKKSKKGKSGKKKGKKQPYTLTGNKSASSMPTEDPYAKYISFYPSKDTNHGMFEEKFAKE